jgi:hypothetical protein
VNLKSLSRYELGNTVPAAGLLKAIADALLSDDQEGIKDRGLFKKFEQIQEMEDNVAKQMIIRFLDLAIRDAKARFLKGKDHYIVIYTIAFFILITCYTSLK